MQSTSSHVCMPFTHRVQPPRVDLRFGVGSTLVLKTHKQCMLWICTVAIAAHDMHRITAEAGSLFRTMDAVQHPPFVFLGSSHFGSMPSLNT